MKLRRQKKLFVSQCIGLSIIMYLINIVYSDLKFKIDQVLIYFLQKNKIKFWQLFLIAFKSPQNNTIICGLMIYIINIRPVTTKTYAIIFLKKVPHRLFCL